MTRILSAYDTQDEITVKILSYCREPHTKTEITAFCGYKDSKSFAKRYLKPLLEQKLLLLTMSDKPTSKNQKYITNAGKCV